MITASQARDRVTTADTGYDEVWTDNEEAILGYIDTIITQAADSGLYTIKVSLSPTHIALFLGDMLARRVVAELISNGYTASVVNSREVNVSWTV